MFRKIKSKLLKKRQNNLKESIAEEMMMLRVQEFLIENELKKQIQKNFYFEIPGYILDDMIRNPADLFLSINVAVLNNRLSEENANYLKQQYVNAQRRK